jgi:decaprenylphospho-beta-D-ribofuranose 2-oxidase
MTRSPTPIAGWGGVPREPCRVAHPADAAAVAAAAAADAPLIARGLGRAYGDSALNPQGTVAQSDRLDRFRSFDPATGMLECESGVSFADVIDCFLPRGWFLPTTPGTKFVTVGGAIAADIHGKNHHRVGSFGNFVDEITMVVGDGSVVRCSRSHDPELFFATLGGMGLTGMILAARFRLVPVETAWITVRHRRTANLDDTLTVFHESDASCEHSVAWIDCMARGERLGRSVVMQGNHATLADLDSRQRIAPLELPHKRTKTVPFTPPVSLLSPLTVRAFNGVFYAAHGDEEKLVDLDAFFYPLDAVLHWNRVYGPRGFVQYQAFFPRESSAVGLRRLLDCVAAAGAASFLAVLKSCGAANGGVLSYLEPGHTLALDMPYHPARTPALCRQLDRILLDHGGRLYLAKDAMTDAETFGAMYPRLKEFQAIKRRVDPHNRFVSLQALRVGIVKRHQRNSQARNPMQHAPDTNTHPLQKELVPHDA